MRMRWKKLVATGAALAIIGCASVLTSAGAAVSPGSIEVMAEASQEISIEKGKGRLLRLPRSVSTVFLADPEVADVQVKSPRMVYLLGKKVGDTSLFGVGRGDDLVTSLKVRVVHDLAWLTSMIQESAPGADVKVQSIEGAIVLSGSVPSAAVAADLKVLAEKFAGEDSVINRLTIAASTQVNLRVRMAEVSRTVIERLGINWDALFDNGTALFGLATGNPAVAAGSFLTRTDGAENVVAGLRTNSVDLNVVIDFLANEGLVTILAEPNLTALNGQKAEFLAGGEFPIVVPQNDGLFTIIFKEFGVSLEFTPTVLSGGRISLHVAPEVSQLSSRGAVELDEYVIPALNKRRAETRVELASGQSFAIAGLLQETMDQDMKKLPGLGDVPVLGRLFRSERYNRGETELVMIVTPYLVRPTSPGKLQAPVGTGPNAVSESGKPISTASGKSPRLLGRSVAMRRAGSHLIGSVGFVLD